MDLPHVFSHGKTGLIVIIHHGDALRIFLGQHHHRHRTVPKQFPVFLHDGNGTDQDPVHVQTHEPADIGQLQLDLVVGIFDQSLIPLLPQIPVNAGDHPTADRGVEGGHHHAHHAALPGLQPGKGVGAVSVGLRRLPDFLPGLLLHIAPVEIPGNGALCHPGHLRDIRHGHLSCHATLSFSSRTAGLSCLPPGRTAVFPRSGTGSSHISFSIPHFLHS